MFKKCTCDLQVNVSQHPQAKKVELCSLITDGIICGQNSVLIMTLGVAWKRAQSTWHDKFLTFLTWGHSTIIRITHQARWCHAWHAKNEDKN